jgi:hypothetical protein
MPRNTADTSRSRQRALGLVQAMVADGILEGRDLGLLAPRDGDPCDPEWVRQDFLMWLRGLGAELVLNRAVDLADCPFSRGELEFARAQGLSPIVSPRGLTAEAVGRLLHFDSWAFTDPLVSSPPEEEDLWFLAALEDTPAHANVSARASRRQLEDSGNLGFSLQRYMIFCARYRFLTGRWPDRRWWSWMLRGRYDRSGILIAGFDPNDRFSVHAWLPHFQAPFVGTREIRLPNTISNFERNGGE